MKTGWTGGKFLFEFLAIALLAALCATACIRQGAQRGDYRVLATKSHGHAIQVAIERYATDNGGEYPPFLYGGDAHATFTTDLSDLDPMALCGDVVLDFTGYTGDPRAIHGDCDVLLQYGYLSKYPQNPFVKKGKPNEPLPISNPLDSTPTKSVTDRLVYAAIPRAGSAGLDSHGGWRYAIPRVPAGLEGNLMWDVSEGQRHPPFTVLAPGERAGGTYGAPNGSGARIEATDFDDTGARGTHVNDTSEFRLHPALPGNFYYYPILEIEGHWNICLDGVGNLYPVNGYRLAVYGAEDNVGQDVYDMFGDFEEKMISMWVDQHNVEGIVVKNFGGPDGRPDGVLAVLSSDTSVKLPDETLLGEPENEEAAG